MLLLDLVDLFVLFLEINFDLSWLYLSGRLTLAEATVETVAPGVEAAVLS